MNKRELKLTGFTLVEVMVVLTLVMLLTGVGLVVYKDYYRSKIVQVAAESWAKEVELLIKKTESGALVKELVDGSNGCQGVYQATVINTTASTNTYTIHLQCSQANSPTFSYQLDKFDPEKQVVFGSDRQITILPLSLGVKTSSNVSVDFCLVTGGASQCYYQVIIDKTGRVDVDKI